MKSMMLSSLPPFPPPSFPGIPREESRGHEVAHQHLFHGEHSDKTRWSCDQPPDPQSDRHLILPVLSPSKNLNPPPPKISALVWDWRCFHFCHAFAVCEKGLCAMFLSFPFAKLSVHSQQVWSIGWWILKIQTTHHMLLALLVHAVKPIIIAFPPASDPRLWKVPDHRMTDLK